MSRKLFLGMALAILFDTAAQILWKIAVADLPEEPNLWLTMTGIIHQPLFLLVGLIMAGQACNWMVVLDHADLSYAHAITSLSYVSVAILSVLCLGEVIEPSQLLGIALILAGVWFVGQSGHSGAPVKGQAA